jgi:hypothetical protein
VLSPPRERPSPSRPAGLPDSCHSPPPPVTRSAGRGPPRAGGMLVRADHGGIGADRPVLALGLIAAGPQPVQDLPPGPVTRPAAIPDIDSLPVPEPLRQVTLRQPIRVRKKIPLIHHPVIAHRPPRGGSAGRNTRSRSHSSSVRSWRFSRSSTVPIYASRASRSTGHALGRALPELETFPYEGCLNYWRKAVIRRVRYSSAARMGLGAALGRTAGAALVDGVRQRMLRAPAVRRRIQLPFELSVGVSPSLPW